MALKALEDELAMRRRPDTVFLLQRFVAATAEAEDSSAWLESLLPERWRGRVPADLFYRFWRANRASVRLGPPSWFGDRPVRVVNVKRIREVNIPALQGLYSCSRVGFNAGRDSALVTVSFACRGLCGSDNLYLYVKSARGWERRNGLIHMVH